MQFWVTLERISMPFVLNQGSLKAGWSCYMLNGSWQFESTYDFFDFSIADDYLQNWNNKYLTYAAEGSERVNVLNVKYCLCGKDIFIIS